MIVCPNCGEENPPKARFCLSCGTPLSQGQSRGEERKVVTVMFCDLVGFTARSDGSDPEDVKATLHPYNARLKQVIEHYGGTIDKFIGDGVLAVFGAPAVHEDGRAAGTGSRPNGRGQVPRGPGRPGRCGTGRARGRGGAGIRPGWAVRGEAGQVQEVSAI